MAKKRQSLTQRIEALINRTGEKPAPSMGDIKSELVNWLTVAQELEDGAVIRDLEAQAEVLKASLNQSNSEKENLQIELNALKAEVEAFRAERKKQQEQQRHQELPKEQFEILQGLPTEHIGDGATLKGISQRASIPPDEAAVRLDRLEKAGLARRRSHQSGATYITAWYRTMPGDELVLAKRLAGEGASEQKAGYKYPELPQLQQELLFMLAKETSEHGFSEKVLASTMAEGHPRLVLFNLNLLREAGYATDSDAPTWGTPRMWFITLKGEEYLAERDLL